MFVRDIYNTEGSKGVPRGPDEWGALLYDQQWARERKVSDPKVLVIGPVIIAMGIAMMAIVAWLLVLANKHHTLREDQRLEGKGR